MKRRYFCLGTSAFALGIVLCIFNVKLFTAFCVIGLIYGMIALCNRKMSILIYALLFVVGGFYGNYADNKSSPLDNYIKEPCSGQMFVTGIESYNDKAVTVTATVTMVNDVKVNEPVLFSIYGIDDIDVNKKIYFEGVKFKIPDEARNDGGFDYNRYLKSRGIYYTASAELDKLKASGTDGFVVLKVFRTLKQKFTRRCVRIWGESHTAEIVPAILSGNDVLIPKDIKDLFSKAGITHILVASGMHVAIVILIFSMLLFPLRNKRRLYNLILWCGIASFALFVGYAPSIIRAVSFLGIYFIAKRSLRSADPVTVLFEAMAVILAINPLTIYSLSFQLSFDAVFGIIMFTPHIVERLSWFFMLPGYIFRLPDKVLKKIFKGMYFVWNAAAVSVSAQLGVLPFMVIAFGGSSVFTVFINIIIALLMPAIYGFGICAVMFNLEPFVAITNWLCNLLIAMARFTTQLPGNYMALAQSNIVRIAMICFVLACLFRCKIKWFKPIFEPVVFVCAIAIMVAYPIVSYIPSDKAEVTFLNVEQGDCAVIRLADHKTVVIDTGTDYMCADELVPYLERKNVAKIDALILSHSDKDHAGGVEYLLNKIKVNKIITNGFDDIKTGNIEQRIVGKGSKFSVGDADFEVLSPQIEHKSDNDNSLVIRMDFGKSSFLFTGDASEKIEKELINVDADVLKVSHHGAKTASSKEFLRAVSPIYSVISVDKDNSYGHPDKAVVERLEDASEAVFRTDRDKTITIMCDKEGKLKLTKRLEHSIINNRK